MLSTAVAVLALAGGGRALAEPAAPPAVVQLAQAAEPQPRELKPRYEPVPPEPQSWYNASYIFGMTRGVANSTMVPAAKAPLFLLTVPLDIVLLPFAAIGGLFG
jgi:hypothetical protein